MNTQRKKEKRIINKEGFVKNTYTNLLDEIKQSVHIWFCNLSVVFVLMT